MLFDTLRRFLGGPCAICRDWSALPLCPACEARFAPPAPRCPGCAISADATRVEHHPSHLAPQCPACRLAPPPWTQMIAAFDYGPPWDRLIAGLKFHQRVDQVHALLQPLHRYLEGWLETRAASGEIRDIRVMPVPLSPNRLRERGYNQAWELARRIARRHALTACADGLLRVRDTGHQLGLRRDARRANLRGAFMVSPRHASALRGMSVAVVDDVLTTGATAEAITRTLLAAGVREVHLWVAARTPPGED